LYDWTAEPQQGLRLANWLLSLPEPRLLLLQEMTEDDNAEDDGEPLSLIPNTQHDSAGLTLTLREAAPETWQTHHRRDKLPHEVFRDFGVMLAELCADQPSELSWHCYLPERISLPLTLRSWREGERIELAGGGSKTLGDVFTDAKVPRSLRRAWAVLADSEDRTVWVPGLVQGARMQIPAGTVPTWHLVLRSGGD
jgi:tRNA(Ile)-lysidine synthetase-like protein